MIFDSQDKIVEVVAEQNRLRMMIQGDVKFSPINGYYNATCKHALFEWCDTIKYCHKLTRSGQCTINTDLLNNNRLQSIQYIVAHKMVLVNDGNRIIRNLPHVRVMTLVVNEHKPGILKMVDGNISVLHIKKARITNNIHNPIPHTNLSFNTVIIDGINGDDVLKLYTEFGQYKEQICEGYTYQRLPDELIHEFIWEKFGVVLNLTTCVDIGNFGTNYTNMRFVRYADAWQSILTV